MRYNRKYFEKISQDPLPPLQEDERIYLNVPYMARGFAKSTNCRFDNVKKLWFTGPFNSFLCELVSLYGVNEITSEKARRLLEEKLENKI